MSKARQRWLIEKVWKRIPPAGRYAITIGSALIISAADVWWAAYANQASEGVRGGAVAAVIALFVLFLRPDWGKRNYDGRLESIAPTATDFEKLAEKVDALEAWMTIDNADHSKQNKALVIATAIGTIFWAFGDVFARHLNHLLSAFTKGVGFPAS